MTFERTRVIATVVAVLTTMSGAALAYTVVTRDGHTIVAEARPEVRGLQAFMRLTPGGQLAVISEGKIDWQRTDAVNPANPVAAPIVIPASTMMTDKSAPKVGGKPIELKLYGGQSARVEAETAAVAQAQPQPKTNAGEAIINLQKEYAQVAAARDIEAAARTMMEQELAQLQSREVGYASETSANEQRIRELVERIASAGAHVGQLETRLGDIRAEVIQLGGAID